jgi:tetratricopeptide (TPR) repeat protein
LDFSTNEKHSFQEWLQLSRIQPIIRENQEGTQIASINKTQKLELIDKFIETNPKIPAVKKDFVPSTNFDLNKEDHSMLMTETLAKVYLGQKKYQKAIQAYEILILKYPEKISFFADRISDIKILQQNNNK